MLVSAMLQRSNNDTSLSVLTVSCSEEASPAATRAHPSAGDAVRHVEDGCRGVEVLYAVGRLHRDLDRGSCS